MPVAPSAVPISGNFTAMTADELKFEEMDFDKWGADLFDDADEALIRKYIEDEANAVNAKKQSDVSTNYYKHPKRCNVSLIVVLNI